jgi:hypothetical protein
MNSLLIVPSSSLVAQIRKKIARQRSPSSVKISLCASRARIKLSNNATNIYGKQKGRRIKKPTVQYNNKKPSTYYLKIVIYDSCNWFTNASKVYLSLMQFYGN